MVCVYYSKMAPEDGKGGGISEEVMLINFISPVGPPSGSEHPGPADVGIWVPVEIYCVSAPSPGF